jgi:hypothetical protein
MKAKLFGLSALLCVGVTSVANSTPFRLDYSITDFGTPTLRYQYDFTLTLDNNDGSWVAGQSFGIFFIGDKICVLPCSTDTNGGGAFGSNTDVVFGVIESSWIGGYALGFGYDLLQHSGPSIRAKHINPAGEAVGGPYVPLSIGEIVTFSLISKTFLGSGSLLWSNFPSDGLPGQIDASFEAGHLSDLTVVPSPVPIPNIGAGLPGIICAGGGLLAWWRRKRKGHVASS